MLKKISRYYELFVFTASSRKYAEIILKVLDPENKMFQGIFCRENCLETKNGYAIKDLRVAKNRDLKNMFLIDNLSHSFSF